jgi:PKD repeat protein
MIVGTGGTVNVPVKADSTWSNITSFKGTFTFDPTVITWNSMANWGLSYPAGAVFTQTTPGVVTFTYSSLISIGGSLGAGMTIFDLKFNVIGAVGTSSAINFIGSPQAMYWGNGFGWSGANFGYIPGSVTIACLAPTAAFTSTPNFYTTNFTNTTTYPGTASWTFGDGGTSTMTNPSHTYAAPGTYTVCLIETSACGIDTTCSTVNVCTNMPISNYTFTQNQTTLNCTDATSGSPNSWSWTFGDGGTSSIASPSHTYATAGTYSVCLISGNGCGIDTACQSVTITCVSPTSNYTKTINYLTAAFTNTSTGLPTSYLWNFGDGTTSTLQNPTHSYATSGTYNACLTTTNVCGTNTFCQNVIINCPVPVLNWSNTTNGLSAVFTDMTTNAPTNWLWNFGDGTTSTQQNPTHIYSAPGTYNVCLYSGNPCGNSSFCQNVTIVCPQTVSNFTNVVTNYSAVFTDQSTNLPFTWAWTFGDGGTSNQQNPNHTYAANGNYIVCLVVSNSCGSSTFCDTISVTCPIVATSWTKATANEVVTFTDGTTNTPLTWAWDFGDGNTSTIQNPVHTYTTSGSYTTCLTTTNNCGTDSSCQTFFISVSGLSDLTFELTSLSPNPAKDYLQINTSFNGLMNVQMFNLQGQLMTAYQVKNEDKIDIQNWAKGSYLLVIDMDGTLVSRKLILE